jgi:hypothetical protein
MKLTRAQKIARNSGRADHLWEDHAVSSELDEALAALREKLTGRKS